MNEDRISKFGTHVDEEDRRAQLLKCIISLTANIEATVVIWDGLTKADSTPICRVYGSGSHNVEYATKGEVRSHYLINIGQCAEFLPYQLDKVVEALTRQGYPVTIVTFHSKPNKQKTDFSLTFHSPQS